MPQPPFKPVPVKEATAEEINSAISQINRALMDIYSKLPVSTSGK